MPSIVGRTTKTTIRDYLYHTMDWSYVFPSLSVQAGLICLVSQLFLSGLFAHILPSGPWTTQPILTAHQVVCLPLMLYLLHQGSLAWFWERHNDNNADDWQGMEGRIFGVVPRGVDMGRIVWGMMIFWDIPISFICPSLQDPLMMMHHFGMCFVSGVGIGIFSNVCIGSYYAPFFFGVIEISSVCLAVVDLFHPKNEAWFAWVNSSTSVAGNLARQVNEASRVLFAIFYLIVRCGLFPYVIFSTCLLDFYQAAMLPDENRNGASSAVIMATCVLCFAFTLLQLNWGVLVAKQVGKAIGIIPDKRKKPNVPKEE